MTWGRMPFCTLIISNFLYYILDKSLVRNEFRKKMNFIPEKPNDTYMGVSTEVKFRPNA